jgi:hypothetical protein
MVAVCTNDRHVITGCFDHSSWQSRPSSPEPDSIIPTGSICR